jgi:uncharacterized membrane protein YcjF (UPF0283 family)
MIVQEQLLQKLPQLSDDLATEVLAFLRLAKQRKRHGMSDRIINPEQAKKNQAAIDLLQSWMDEEDTGEDAQAWTNLNADRLSDRH